MPVRNERRIQAENQSEIDMPSAKFEGVVLSGHKEHAVEVPFDPAERWSLEAKSLWSGRRGHAVRGKANGVRFESFIVPRSKRFWMLIDGELLESARIEEGDTLAVEIEPRTGSSDAKPRKASTRSTSSRSGSKAPTSSRSRTTSRPLARKSKKSR
jgi:hypothetical protein